MRNPTLVLMTFLLAGLPLAADAGTITKVTASPAAVVTGQTVTFTEEGTNPCGAANLNYGDGVAITYAITGLPAQQTHVFETPGTYTVIARGMGNCDGETTTTVQVKPAAVPPSPRGPHIKALAFAPSPGAERQPVTLIVNGEGSCRFTTTFGDGNSRELNVQLPYRFDHTYALPGTYTVIVAPIAPCTGKFTERLIVASPNAAPRLLDLTIEPSPTDAGTPVTITVRGTGACRYAIDFGDGNDDSATVPDRLRHTYPAGGEYTVTATATAPCTGSVWRVVQVRVR